MKFEESYNRKSSAIPCFLMIALKIFLYDIFKNLRIYIVSEILSLCPNMKIVCVCDTA